jgi:hypothetical protein
VQKAHFGAPMGGLQTAQQRVFYAFRQVLMQVSWNGC